jgi:septum formation protein
MFLYQSDTGFSLYRFFFDLTCMIHLSKVLILASASPRRAHLLRQMGLNFTVQPVNIDERHNGREPVLFATEISSEKALTVAHSRDNAIIIAADTIVVLDGKILGKPRNPEDAQSMLRSLSGRMHEVITGYTIIDRPSDYIIVGHEKTQVWFRKLDPAEIEIYVASGSPMDKAGAYGIQDDFGAVFVKKIDGCYYNVVGLPLTKVYQDLKQCIAYLSNQT